MWHLTAVTQTDKQEEQTDQQIPAQLQLDFLGSLVWFWKF